MALMYITKQQRLLQKLVSLLEDKTLSPEHLSHSMAELLELRRKERIIELSSKTSTGA